MSRTILSNLYIKNFKGIREMSIGFNEILTIIKGMNGVGKSSVYDAFMWLINGTNSLGATDKGTNAFSRPKDSDGKMDDEIDTEVTGTFKVDGSLLVLKKIQNENRPRVKGTDTYVSKGRKNSFFVNDVKKSEAEFNSKIAEIADADTFKLLTNLDYFMSLPNDDVKGKKGKMSLLLELAQDVTDESIINADPQKWLPVSDAILSIGTKEAMLLAKRDKANLEKMEKEIGPRVDEISMQKRDVPDTSSLNQQVDDLNEKIAYLKEMCDTISADSTEAQLRKRKIEVFNAINEINAKATADAMREKSALQTIYSQKKSAFQSKSLDMKLVKAEVESAKARIASYTEDLDGFKGRWKEASARQFPEEEKFCKSCGQILPKDRIESLKATFTEQKEKDVQHYVARGREIRAKLEIQKQLLAEKEKELGKIEKEVAIAVEEMDSAEKQYTQYPETPDLSTNQELEGLNVELAKIEENIRSMNEGYNKLVAIKLDIESLETELRSTQKQIADAEAIKSVNESIEQRIEDLRAEKSEIGQKFALAEQRIVLLEEFCVVRSRMLSEKINSCFKIARFSLIDEYQSGGVNPTVRVVFNGVQDENINNGHLLLTKIDIINAFQKHYNCYLPLFIDNAECLSSDNQPETDCQLILLKVTDDPELVVVV